MHKCLCSVEKIAEFLRNCFINLWFGACSGQRRYETLLCGEHIAQVSTEVDELETNYGNLYLQITILRVNEVSYKPL